MLPEKTNYLTNGIDGQKRLAQGPELSSYRGLSIIHSRKFSMDTGTTPRDLLRRRVRVAEYYRIPWNPQNPSRSYEFYDQSRDTMFRLTWDQLCKMAKLPHGAGGGDDDFPGHYGDYWQIMGGAEPPEDFDFADSDDDPGVLRLRVHGKVGADTELKVDGIDTVLSAMGFNVGMKHKTSSLVWPRTIHNVNGDSRKKRKIESLSTPAQTLTNSPSSRYIYNAMNDMQKFHHRQSETFGAGLFNDPLSDDIDSVTKDWAGLKESHTDHAKVAGLCVQAFFDLHQELGLDKAERQLRAGVVQPSPYEWTNPKSAAAFTTAASAAATGGTAPPNPAEYVGKSFEAEAAVRALMVTNKKDNCADYWADNNQITFVTNALSGITLPSHKSFDSTFDDIMQCKTYSQSAAPVEILANTHRFNEIEKLKVLDKYKAGTSSQTNLVVKHAAQAILHYINVLVEWRKLCWGDAVQYLLENNAKGGTTFSHRGNCGGHEKFEKLRLSLITACLSFGKSASSTTGTSFDTDVQTLSSNMFIFDTMTSGTVNKTTEFVKHFTTPSMVETVMTDIANNNTNGKIVMNMLNAGLGTNNVLKQPNLHINRCKPLNQISAADSATSLNPSSWLLQHLASMFPIDKEMADMFLRENTKFKGKFKLEQQYRSFLTHDKNLPNTSTSISDYNTFLMHWFMSEFHPTHWVREMAKKAAGDMQTTEFRRVQNFLNAMADALIANKTFTDSLQTAGHDMTPRAYESGNTTSFYSTAIATDKYEYIEKWTKNKDLHVANMPWVKVPVDGSHESSVVTIPEYSGITKIENVASSTIKQFAKAASKYGRAGMNELTAKFRSNIEERDKVKYFDADIQDVRTPGTSEHMVNFTHPWTCHIPGGVEALSSTKFPIDYRSTHSNPTDAVHDIYSEPGLRHAAESAANYCREHPESAIRDVLLVIFSRFFKPAARFYQNGAGVPLKNNTGGYFFPGCHLKHGPYVAEISDSGPGGSACAQDIVILRPNIEHEMLGIIMGRGGTQELGATFWGQTELSCYDDAQHGKYQSNLCMSCLTLSMLLTYGVINRYLGHELQVSFE